jgi:crossover junction endodeoxyribonuclease RusA
MAEARLEVRPVVLRLPYPPSVNHYWRRVGAKTLISREGRRFRDEVVGIVREQEVKPIGGPVDVYILAARPDRRRRDIDNILKSLLDALDHAGVYDDDSQIWRLEIEWAVDDDGELAVLPGGGVIVTIQEL